ncbi:MAG TPA: hypothetical protein ENI71_00070 [Chromatiales bacterium]|nr:hypothetical protein [Chromatiales bacterium]
MRAVVLGFGLLLPAWAGAVGGGAAAPGIWQVSLAFSATQFHYEESVNGGVLDRENGLLPGLDAGLGYARGAWFAHGALRYHGDAVDYDGQTQSGILVASRTNEGILDVSLLGGHRWRRLGRWRVSAYGGLGYRRWQRDIRSTPIASGVFETYRWGYGFLGATIGRRLGARARWSLDGRVSRTMGARVAVDFKGAFDSVSLAPGARFAGRLALRFAYRLARAWSVQAVPYVEWWNLGQSSARPLTRGGASFGSMFEPRSETRVIGFELGVSRRF